MPTHAGPNTFGEENLVFGYDLADTVNSYVGEPTTNLAVPTWSNWGVDASGYSTTGTRTILSPYHVRIDDVSSNTRQSFAFYSGFNASTTYTFSVKFKKIAGAPTLRFQIYSYVGGNWTNQTFPTTAQIGLTDKEGWQTASYSYTTAAGASGIYWYIQDGDDYTAYTHSFELKEIQLEAKLHATPFVAGTRSATQGLLDLASNSTINLSSVSFNSNAQLTFDGTDDTVPIGIVGGYSSNITCEAVFRTTSGAGWKNMISGGCGDIIFTVNGNLLNFGAQCSSPIPHANYSNTVVNTGAWFHAVATYDGVRVKIYINGVLENTYARSGSFTPSALRVGSANGGVSEFFQGDLPLLKVYNRALTESEVARNFNAIKSRFNI